jgi:flagellar secretion chaperone FliS
VVENPYAAYSQSSMVGASPLQLVTRSYEGAIGAVQQAQQCFASGDIMGRSKAITKAVSILTELMISLDHQKGGEISAGLKRLYSYMQQRLLMAHAQKKVEPLIEVIGLLSNLLEAWKVVEQKSAAETQPGESQALTTVTVPTMETEEKFAAYGSYFGETRDGSVLGESYSF